MHILATRNVVSVIVQTGELKMKKNVKLTKLSKKTSKKIKGGLGVTICPCATQHNAANTVFNNKNPGNPY